jgi:hypothetical protein
MFYFCSHQPWIRTQIDPQKFLFETNNELNHIFHGNQNPYIRFGQYLLNNPTIPLSQGERQFLKTEVLTERRQKKNLAKKLKITTIEMFTQNQSRSYLLFCSNSKIVYFSYSDETKVVQMTWIFPHAMQILEATQYFEIDSSFEVFRPFVFSVP